ncbi:MAG: preprotein translocase subunit YajC, partial [bacterium]|nr:preprotein translocase subunit YajC [bacterium]
PLLAILALLFYFVVIRPEKQKEAAAEKRKSSIKKNDHVETIGGIFGVVTNVTEKHITVRVDENSNAKIKLRRSAIARIVGEDEEADDTDSSK